jgi:hypothetical protein
MMEQKGLKHAVYSYFHNIIVNSTQLWLLLVLIIPIELQSTECKMVNNYITGNYLATLSTAEIIQLRKTPS